MTEGEMGKGRGQFQSTTAGQMWLTATYKEFCAEQSETEDVFTNV
jgi:hypothetical protein